MNDGLARQPPQQAHSAGASRRNASESAEPESHAVSDALVRDEQSVRISVESNGACPVRKTLPSRGPAVILRAEDFDTPFDGLPASLSQRVACQNQWSDRKVAGLDGNDPAKVHLVSPFA